MILDDIDSIERILSQLPACIFFKDTKARYVFATQYWRHLNKGSDDGEWTIKGKTDLDIRKDKANAQIAYDVDMKIIETGEGVDYTIKEVTDGEVEYLQIIKQPVRDDAGNIIGIVGLINNVTKQMLLEQKLSEYMVTLKLESETDPLTGISNRRSGELLINNRKEAGMLCLMDVDKFKYVNDNWGHDVGDELLVGIARVLKESFRETDVVIRMGGDEFAVFAPKVETEEVAEMIIKRFFSNLSEMKIEGLSGHKVTVSMGVCFASLTDSYEKLYKKVDETMYVQKKELGGDGYRFT